MSVVALVGVVEAGTALSSRVGLVSPGWLMAVAPFRALALVPPRPRKHEDPRWSFSWSTRARVKRGVVPPEKPLRPAQLELLERADLAGRRLVAALSGPGHLGDVHVAAGVHDQAVRGDELAGLLAREAAADAAEELPVQG